MIASGESVNNAVLRKPNDRPPYNFRPEPIVFDRIKRACGMRSDEEVRRLISTLGAGGGYILSGSHLYQADIPVENIAAIHGGRLP